MSTPLSDAPQPSPSRKHAASRQGRSDAFSEGMDRDAVRLELLFHVPTVEHADAGLETAGVEMSRTVADDTFAPAHTESGHQVQDADAPRA